MTPPTPLSLEEVLDMLLEEYESPSAGAVTVYSQRYPSYRAELLRFAATWAEEHYLPEPKPFSPEVEQTLEARAQSFLHNALFERASLTSASTEAGPPLVLQQEANTGGPSLAQLARQAGRPLHEVAREIGMSLPLMSELNGRGFRPETIPQRLVRRLSQLLGVAPSSVTLSWTGPPSSQPSMAFLATAKPQRPQRDFAAAVRESDLSPEQQADLLDED